MKKLLIFICAALILFSMSGIATASYFFDFEDGIYKYDPLNGLEITQLRIHDSGILDVGMDNLEIYSAPIPATVWIFGTGLVGIVGMRRKLRD